MRAQWSTWFSSDAVVVERRHHRNEGVERRRRGVGPARGMPVADDQRGICGAGDRLGAAPVSCTQLNPRPGNASPQSTPSPMEEAAPRDGRRRGLGVRDIGGVRRRRGLRDKWTGPLTRCRAQQTSGGCSKTNARQKGLQGTYSSLNHRGT